MLSRRAARGTSKRLWVAVGRCGWHVPEHCMAVWAMGAGWTASMAQAWPQAVQDATEGVVAAVPQCPETLTATRRPHHPSNRYRR